MTKAIISNRIYLKIEDRETLKYITDQLTYKIQKKTSSKHIKAAPIEIIRNYKYINGVLSIPQGRVDLIPAGHEIVDKRVYNEVPFPNPIFPLREGQQLVYDQVDDTCFINALVGWGKTFTALHIARKLGQKTLIVTHTTMLRDQWIKEVETLYNMPCGIIGSGQFDIEDHAIVVGNIQSIVKYQLQLSKEFGLIILDEAHHVPATTFGNVIDSMYARYRIALSGTMERTDGKHVIFKDYFGSKVFKPPQSHTLDPIVRIIQSGLRLPAGKPWVEKMNELLYDEAYQEFIAGIARVQLAKGHKVLVVADRVEFLSNVKELIGESCILVTGGSSFEERTKLIAEVEAGTKSCIAGSRQIFSEGISVNVLSCVILAVPTSNPISLEQIIGRIMRLGDNKLQPEVIDIAFSSMAEKKQGQLRQAFYVSKGWDIEKISA